jgi:hypothetical protein
VKERAYLKSQLKERNLMGSRKNEKRILETVQRTNGKQAYLDLAESERDGEQRSLEFR